MNPLMRKGIGNRGDCGSIITRPHYDNEDRRRSSMKIGITGLSNSGKTTVFNALTGQNMETTLYANTAGEPNMGMVKVPDARVDRLAEIFKPKKTTHSTVQYIDYIGITKGDMKQNKLVFEFIKDADAMPL